MLQQNAGFNLAATLILATQFTGNGIYNSSTGNDLSLGTGMGIYVAANDAISAVAAEDAISVGNAWNMGAGKPDYYIAGEQIAPSTVVNARVVLAGIDENPMSAMLKVASLLASKAVDLDADISRMVDQHFWDLI